MRHMISVIIPTYNRSYLLGQTLESILGQTYEVWECIVVDDGSSDYTPELMEFYVRKDKRFHYVERPANRSKGANSCRNYGFELSGGQLIKWFDSDDILHPNYMASKLASYEDNTDVIICNFDYFDIDTSLAMKVVNHSEDERLLADYVTGRINLNLQSVLWKKEAVKNFKFDESLYRAQEVDFHFRILKEKKVIASFVDEALVSIRGQKESLTGNFKGGRFESVQSELRVRRQILDYVVNLEGRDIELRKCLRMYLNGLRSFLKFSSLNKLMKELKLLESILCLKGNYWQWKFGLLVLLVISGGTGREYRLHKHFFNLNGYLCNKNH